MNGQSFEELKMSDYILNTTVENWVSINPNSHLRINYNIEYEEIERED